MHGKKIRGIESLVYVNVLRCLGLWWSCSLPRTPRLLGWRQWSVTLFYGHDAWVRNFPTSWTPLNVLARPTRIVAGFLLLNHHFLLISMIADLRTGWGPESFGGRGGRGGFGTGGAGGRGRPGGAGGFGSGLLGGRAGSGIRGIRSLITRVLATRPPCYRTLLVETSHRLLTEFVVPPALGGAFLFHLYTAPNRSGRSVVLLDLFCTLTFSYLAEMIYD